MIEGKNTSSESSDSTQDYAIDYNDIIFIITNRIFSILLYNGGKNYLYKKRKN